jgi:hypothetical protein
VKGNPPKTARGPADSTPAAFPVLRAAWLVDGLVEVVRLAQRLALSELGDYDRVTNKELRMASPTRHPLRPPKGG